MERSTHSKGVNTVAGLPPMAGGGAGGGGGGGRTRYYWKGSPPSLLVYSSGEFRRSSGVGRGENGRSWWEGGGLGTWILGGYVVEFHGQNCGSVVGGGSRGCLGFSTGRELCRAVWVLET